MSNLSFVERELLKVAEVQVVEAQKWEYANECEWPEDLEKDYLAVCEKVNEVKREVADTLEANGWPVYRKYITGVACDGVDHYDVDQLVKENFGSYVSADSENGCLFIDVTADKAEEVLEFIKKCGAGDNFSLRDVEEVHGAPAIAGIGNWNRAKKLVETFNFIEQ